MTAVLRLILSYKSSVNSNTMSFIQFYGFVIPMFLGAVILMARLVEHLKYKKIVQKYSAIKSNLEKTSNLTDVLVKSPIGQRIIQHISIRIGIISGYSYVRNCNIASKILVTGFVAALGLFGIFFAVTRQVWYVSLSYSILLIAIVYLLLNSVSEIMKGRFTSKIPDTFKILNLRYVSCGDIIKAIETSMEDFDIAIRREMLNIYNTLRKNNASEIIQAFRLIERTYQDKYMTVLLNLIEHAYYKGGRDAIGEQLEKTAEEALDNAENKKDLKSAINGYLIMSLVIPAAVFGVECFNQYALLDQSSLFYSGPAGLQLKVSLFILTFIYMVILNNMKKQ